MVDTTLKLILLGEDKSASRALGAVGIGAAVAGAALLKFGSDAVSAYLDAEKQQAKLADAFTRFPKLADTNIGKLTELNEAIQRKVGADADDLAAAQATMAQYDLTGKQLERVTPLLVDYATKTGKDMPDAATSLGKALMGNARAMKDLGIDFKVTGDRAADFDTLIGMLDEKVGGYADSIPEAEKQQKILAATFEDLQEDIGEKLLPAMVGLLDTGQRLVDWASDNQAVLVPLGQASAVAAGAIGALTLAAKATAGVKAMSQTVKALGDAYAGLSVKAKVATVSLGAVGIALGVGTAIWAAYAGERERAEQAVADFTTAIQADSGALGENTRAAALNLVTTQGLVEKASRMGISSEALADAIMGEAEALDYVREKMADYLKANADNEGAITGAKTETDDLSHALGGISTSLATAKDNYQEYRTATGEAATATRDSGDAAGDAAGEYEALTAAMADYNREQLTLRGDHRAIEAAYDDARETIRKYRDELVKKGEADGLSKEAAEKAADATIRSGKALDTNTEAGRKNEEALDKIASTALQVKSGMEEAGVGADEVGAEMDRARTQFLKVAKQMGLSKEEAEKLAVKLGLIKSKEVDIKVRWDLPRESAKVIIGGSTYSMHVKGGRFAVGGFPTPSGWAMVGEQGPEAVRLPVGSHVYPATSKQTRSVTHPQPAPVNISFIDDALGTGRKLYNILREVNQANGGRGLSFT